MIDLGFRSEIPLGWMAILAPRSSTGAKFGLELNNTVGFIDSDYRKNWLACMKTKSGLPFSWAKGERVLQFTLVRVYQDELIVTSDLGATERLGGFGSTGTGV